MTKTKKIVAGAIGLAMVFSFALPSQAATVEELTAQISSLLATIASLQTQLTAMQGGTTTTTGGTGYVFSKDLTIGSTGADVTALQQILVARGHLVMPTGVSMGYFGSLTQAAVSKFQAANGISPTAGYVGPITRAKLNSLGGTTGGTTTIPTGGTIAVAAATQPVQQLAPQSAARVPFTRFTLTAGSSDVVVNSVTVTRVGAGQDAAFAGVVLVDENGTQIGLAKTLNSNHMATIGEAFTVKAGTTRTLLVAGNMAASLTNYAGEVPAFQVTSINTSAPVVGSLPITGTAQVNNNTLTIGSVSMTETYDPGAQNKEIGTTNYKFGTVKVTAGSGEDVRLYSIRWNQSGSASASDLANIMTEVDGVKYPTVISTDGKYYTTSFGSGIVIAKGFSKEISVIADIVGGPERTVSFDIYRNTDLYLSGEVYGYGVTPPTSGSAGTFGSTQPWFNGSDATIKPGTVVTIGKANEVPSQTIAINVPNQTLGGFKTNFKGEPVVVQGMVFTIASSSGSGYGLLTSVTVVDSNGAVVAGPIDAAYTSASVQTVTFTDSVTFPVGTKVYTVKGKVASTIGDGTKYTVTTVPSGWTSPTGETTGNSVDLSGSGTFDMNQVTVESGALAISISAVPASQSVVAGASEVLMANYVFDATQSGEDVRFNSIILTLGGTGTATHLTNCQLYDGSSAITTGYTGGATVTMALNSQIVIAKNTSKTLGLKCDINSGASGNFVWGVTTSTSNPAVTGVSSGSDIDASGGTLTGSTISIGNPSLAVSAHSDTPVFGLMAAGTSNNTIGVLNVYAGNSTVVLSELGLTFSNVASNVSSITVWNGATQVATFSNPSNTTATTTFSSTVTVPANDDVQLTLKANLNQIGVGEAGVPGATVKAQFSGIRGNGGGTEVYGTGSTSFAGKQIQKGYPEITYTTTSGTATDGSSDNDLLVVNVKAVDGDVQLHKLTFGFSSSTATANGFGLSGPNGLVSSTTSNTYGGLVNSATTTISIFFDSTSNTSDKNISEGATKAFTLRAYGVNLLGGTDGDSGTLSVFLKADTATTSVSGSYLLGTATELSTANVVWSPISTTTASTLLVSSKDWTNGYALPGCFATAGLGANCAQRSISN